MLELLLSSLSFFSFTRVSFIQSACNIGASFIPVEFQSRQGCRRKRLLQLWALVLLTFDATRSLGSFLQFAKKYIVPYESSTWMSTRLDLSCSTLEGCQLFLAACKMECGKTEWILLIFHPKRKEKAKGSNDEQKIGFFLVLGSVPCACTTC